jgi:hypothetical protein
LVLKKASNLCIICSALDVSHRHDVSQLIVHAFEEYIVRCDWSCERCRPSHHLIVSQFFIIKL